MSPPLSEIGNSDSGSWGVGAWFSLVATVVLATAARLLFFTGFYGSDEATYAEVALQIANGVWRTFDYVGSLRYGANLPSAFFISVLGASELAANMWSLLCSVGEVVLVFVFARHLWGNRAAVFSAVVIALLPLHVHFGGRLMADAPLAFFITLSFFLFWIAEKRQGAVWYFATGLAAGFVFWIKEVVIVYWIAFAIFALVYRIARFEWIWIGLGAATAIGANCVLLWWITGDPLYLYNVIRSHAGKYVAFRDQIDSSPWYYFRYLFVDVRHTWLMAYAAMGGIAIWAGQAIRKRRIDSATGYVVIWSVGLLAVFSFVPISLNPLTLIAKQTNYMLIFVAPFCLLAGYFLASLPRPSMILVLVAYIGGATILAGLEQQAVRVFTANSRATLEFARSHRDMPVYAMTNGYRAGSYEDMLRQSESGKVAIKSITELFPEPDAAARETAPSGLRGYAVVDLQTASWGIQEPIRKISDVPSCWGPATALESVPERGFGYRIAVWVFDAVSRLPAPLSARLAPPFEALVRPLPAYVYSVPARCTARAPISSGGLPSQRSSIIRTQTISP